MDNRNQFRTPTDIDWKAFDEATKNASFGAFIFTIIFVAVFIYLGVKFLRWFWKVNQEMEQLRLLKEESAKTSALLERVV